jgi:hypothetical protein
MANTILKIKQSAQAGKVPEAEQLQQGELALNTADQKLYSKNSSGTVFEVTASAESVLPPMTSHAGKFLKTTGSVALWENIDTFSNLDGGMAASIFGAGDNIFDGGSA